MLKKILKYTFSVLFIILLLGGLSLYIYLKNTAPIYKGELPVEVLTKDVSVKYDKYGIPHIYAENAEDAYRALGYVHAQDRMFQMEMIRRLSGGRLAEILGAKLVKTDKFFRMLGIRRMAEKNVEYNFQNIQYDWQRQTLAYLEGINNYVNTGKTPLEFTILGIPKTEFDLVDVYSTLGYMGLGFSRALKDDPILEKIRLKHGDKYFEDWKLDNAIGDTLKSSSNLFEDLSSIIPQDVEVHLANAALPLWYGSNCWAVSPEKSSSGKVILANDTHIGTSQPSVWYEAHISYPGFDFYGNYLAGIPFGVIGHTKERGWGLTIFPFDGIDLYREKSNPANSNQVWETDKWVDLTIQEEVIKVKDEDDILVNRKLSRHGPIINSVSEALDSNELNPISFWWNFMSKPTSTLQAIQTMNYAQNMEQVKNAVAKIDFIGLNVLYGDQEGNIAHWAAGRIPKRPDHVNSKFILDGASGKDELLGFYDFKDNPKIENPESGFIASANNDPGVVHNNYFHGYYCPPNRYNRITNALSNKQKWSQNEMKTIQLDEVSEDHKLIANLMISILKSSDTHFDELSNSVINALEKWDGTYGFNQIEPTIFTKFLYHSMFNTMADEIGKADFDNLQGSYVYKGSLISILNNENSIWWDDISTTDKLESREEAISKAFFKSIQELINQLGDDWTKWEWRKVHFITHKHPLGAQKPLDKFFNVGPFPVTGGNDVPNKMMYKPKDEGNYEVYSSPALRIILDFSNVYASESINPTGQSGNVMSPHYQDQAIMFNKGIYRAQLMDSEDINLQSTTLLLKANN